MAEGQQPEQPTQQPMQFESFGLIKGMQTNVPRAAVATGYWSWIMNFQPLGQRTFRAMKDAAAPIYAAPAGASIVYIKTGAIGSPLAQVALVFLADGSAVQVNTATLATTAIGPAGTFFNSTIAPPHAVQWSSSGFVIISELGYWAWDGTTLFSAGGAAPTWLYPSGSSVTTMPTGIKGTALEIFQSTVWLVNGRNLQASAPGGGNNFATSAGGVSFTATDSYVRQGYIGLKQLNGYLYIFADGGVDVISDVTTSGSPATTSFLRLNVDPELGCFARDSIQVLGSAIFYANQNGVYAVSGGNSRKISDEIQDTWNAAIFPTYPSGFIAQVNGITCYGIGLQTADPDTSATIVGCALFDGTRWFLGSQSLAGTIFSVQNVNSTIAAWASDGANLYQMFGTASATLTKKVKSGFSPGRGGVVIFKQVTRLWAEFGNSSSQAAPAIEIDTDGQSATVQPLGSSGILQFVNNSAGNLNFVNNTGGALTFVVTSSPLVAAASCAVYGILFGMTLTTTQAALDLLGLTLGYREETPYA